jgi:L-amino acid N-acyltransferase YncA
MVDLRDGSTVCLRHVEPADAAALLAFMKSLSPESRQLRFFTAACDIDAAARWAASADGDGHIGLVAVDPGGRVIGHAACLRLYGSRGEVAVEVDERHRHRGVATLLLRHLAQDAEQRGIRRLIAEVLPENLEMLSVFDDEFNAAWRFNNGEVDVEFPSSAWQLAPNRPAQSN